MPKVRFCKINLNNFLKTPSCVAQLDSLNLQIMRALIG